MQVSPNFVDRVRMLLIRLAQTEQRPPSERNRAIEQDRQYLEGYLGIDRGKLMNENPPTVDEVLKMTGILRDT